MAANIDYYFTCASPFCYLGHRLFCDIAEKHKATVNFKAVNLKDVWAVSGAVPPGERPPVRQRMRLVELQRQAHYRKLPIKIEPKFWPTDPGFADRIAVGLVESGIDPRYFINKVLGGLWAYDDDIRDEHVLASYLSQCGLDPLPALTDAKTDWAEEIRRNNARAAIGADVVGVPTYVYNGEAFFGQDRLEHLDQALSEGRAPFVAPR
ncbi:MAG: disulfide bond formation protein DsbA [Hoeflea sp.]|nr:disulfide bond formation protein DsbA [Hoeflea sp.]|tara:strand:+ start:7682 stop:8305 length:624 start_codon:yes stop_codon:yes gene_type:complete